MSKKLILVRHAQAGESENRRDFDRPLTMTGERDARHMARWLYSQYKEVDAILSSDAARARTTAEIIEHEYNYDQMIELNSELYEASVRTFSSIITSLDESTKCVVIVGHNPTITYLSDYLTGSALAGMEPGSAVIIKFGKIKWEEVIQGSGTLLVYQSPNKLNT